MNKMLLSRINSNSKEVKGMPYIRNTRISSYQVIEVLGSNMVAWRVFEEYPTMSYEDIEDSLL